MSQSDHPETIYRTTPRRVGKMLAIIIGIQIVGGLIFFTHYDYWNSYLPQAGKLQEEQMEKAAAAASGASGPSTTQGSFTGTEHDVSLKFVESPDFKNYGFNAPIGSPGANPEVDVKVGDKIVFSVTNGGKSFHAFAITASTSGPGPAIDGTTIGTADNPMKPGQSGTVTFIPGSAGTYYYICAVPGHRELGMEGKIVVGGGAGGGAAGVAPGTGGTVSANGNKVSYSLSFDISSDFSKYGFNGTIGAPGANPDIEVHSGDTVTIHLTNPSKSFHAFGIVTDPNNPSGIVWNAAYKTPDNPMKPGESGDVTFVAGTPGLYHYICTVPGHAALGMDGHLIVEK
ncbi:MAG: multicopper oxidase domain-containing protein [Thaumarchaeota archaeon]|nr:multicopper oxidase domain-containing protein [Nitrososphaerota archaeon]